MLGNQQGLLVSHWKFLLVKRHVQAAHTGSKGWHITAGTAAGFSLSFMHSPSLEAAHNIWNCQVHVMLDRERHTGGSYTRLVHAQSCRITYSVRQLMVSIILLCDLPCSARCLVHAVDDSGESTLFPLCKLCSVSLCSTVQPS